MIPTHFIGSLAFNASVAPAEAASFGRMVSSRSCAALAPDAPYDSYGCFSGSAAELPDGRHLLMYTGVRQEGRDKAKEYQTQCIAVGDGTGYRKYEKNPVLGADALPEGLSPYDFRDPKIWRTENGTYRCVVGAHRQDKRGVLLQYESRDGFEWAVRRCAGRERRSVRFHVGMPGFFPLDGKQVVFVSPQDMLPEGFEYHNGNGTVCLTGQMDGDRFETVYQARIKGSGGFCSGAGKG